MTPSPILVLIYIYILYIYIYIYIGRRSAIFGPLLRGQRHSLNVNHSVLLVFFTRGSPGVFWQGLEPTPGRVLSRV